MASRNEGASVDQGTSNIPSPEKKRNFLQRIFGSRKSEGVTRETLTKGKPSMEEIKKTMDKLGITPEQIKNTREMLANIGISVEKNSSVYDVNLQNALIQFQDKFGAAHPSILDVAVTQDGVTTLVENGYVQQASYGILGRGVMSVLREISEARGGINEIKEELLQSAIAKNSALAATLSINEQEKIYDALGVSPSTGFGSRAFVDVVQRYQHDNGLIADGWIGKNGPTFRKLTTLTVEPNPTTPEPYSPKPPSYGRPTAQPKPPASPKPSVAPNPTATPSETGENSERAKEAHAILDSLRQIPGLETATLESVGIHFDATDGSWDSRGTGLTWIDTADVTQGLKLADGYEVNKDGKIIKKEIMSPKPAETLDTKWARLSPDFKAAVSDNGNIREPSDLSEIVFYGHSFSEEDKNIYLNAAT